MQRHFAIVCAVWLLLTGVVQASGTIATIAISGQEDPDGYGSFLRFSSCSPWLGPNGEIVFFASTSEFRNSPGVFRHRGSDLTTVQRRGDAAPDGEATLTGPGCNFGIDSDGEVAVATALLELGGTPVLYRSLGAGLQEVMRHGDPAPGGGATLLTPIFVRAVDAGRIGFDARLFGGGHGQFDRGILIGDVNGLTVRAASGQASPDGDGVLSVLFSNHQTSRNGDVVLAARLSASADGQASDRTVVFAGEYSAVVLREGQAAPGGNGVFDEDFTPTLNNLGEVLVRAGLRDTAQGSDDDVALVRWQGRQLAELLRKGERLGGGPEVVSDMRGLNLGDAGHVALRVEYDDDASQQGILRRNSSGWHRLARTGKTAADAVSRYEALHPPFMSPNGTLVFRARLRLLGEANEAILVALPGARQPSIVVRAGQPLAGSRIVFPLLPSDRGIASSPTTLPVNDRGQVVFIAFLEDGREGVFLYTPSP